MRAVAIISAGEIELIDLPDPTPGNSEVVVEVAAVGICGTDLHIFEGEFAPKLPIVPGHEMSGTVVAVGKSVTEVKIGDAVAIDPSLHCGECFYCRRARGNLCENWNALGVTYPGAAAQFLLSPKKNIHKLPKNVDLKSAALIEPLSCAVRGFDQLPRNPGSHYLIYGSGTMGLMMAELAKVNGAASVSIVDLNQDKLKTAKVLGFTNLAKSADEFDQPRGFDVVIDCTGVTEAIKDGLKHVMPGGTFLQFGVANKGAKVEIEPFWVYNKEITIVGSMAVLHSFDRAVELFASGVLNADVMISDRYSLENYADALTAFKSGKRAQNYCATKWMSMKSLLLSQIDQIKVVDLATPEIATDKSVIKVLACGLCGTDRHIYKGEYPSAKPVILGHEFGGVIETPAVGSKFSKGDLVSVDPNIVCGTCEDCKAGRTAFCPSLTALGVNINGGFAEYAQVPDSQIYKVSNDLNPLHLAFIEPTACCIRGMDIADLKGGEKVAVLGGGVMGQIVVQLAKLAGASQITMITRQRARRELSEALGATDSVDPLEKNYPDKLSKYDVVFECAGAIESFNAAQVIARRGGSIVVLGLTPEKSFVDFNPFQLVIKELRIQGSFLNPLTQRRAANLIDSKKLKLDPLISRVLTLDEVPEILNKPPADGDIKYIVKP